MWRKHLKIFFLITNDILIFYVALGLTLFIRYVVIDFEPANFYSAIPLHLIPFSIIFLFWLITFWIAGLYDITKLRNEELFYKTLLTAFAANTALSIAFFYFIPYFIITPKISMFIDLALTALILYFWRSYYNKWARKAFKIGVIFLGASDEVLELKDLFNKNPQLGYEVA